ncbi:MAG: apolipoprotein N-acyltransferase [Halobacteriovoraceae bacterium]|nr:apolipoprotein N-acyltransferase [Halobacteriovoraceae bacterium]
MHPLLKSFLVFSGGLLYAASFPLPYSFKAQFLLAIPAISILLFYLTDHKNDLKNDIKNLLIFSSGYYILGFYWVAYTIEQFGKIPFPLNYLLGLGLILFILPQYLVFILGKHFLKNKKIFHSLKENISFKNINLALLFSLLEYLTPQQFPAHIGHPWMNMAPHLGLAPWFGMPIFSFFGFWMALSLVDYIKTKKRDYMAVISYLIFFVFNMSLPLNTSNDIPNRKTTHLRLVQANIGNFMKRNSKDGNLLTIKYVKETYYKLSTLPSEFPIDLIIWPETAFPLLLSTEKMAISPVNIPSVIQKIMKTTNAELFMGGFAARGDYRENFESEYNSAFLFGQNETPILKDFYHKIKLIPFGERLPFGFLNKSLSRYVRNISYFAVGNQFTLFSMRNDSHFISAICYEILFPGFIRNYLNHNEKQADFIINLTNDSWYGDTSEPYQHLFLAKWRAVEFNIPIVRMTNTGISSLIFPDGSESRRTSIDKKEILDLKLSTSQRKKTPYQKYGIWGLIFLVILLNLSFYKKFLPKKNSKHQI